LLLRVSYGDAFASAAPALMWAAAGLVPSLSNAGRKVYLYAHGRERVVLWWSTVAWVIQIVGCLALGHRFGAAGVTLSMAVAEAAIWWPLRAKAANADQIGGGRTADQSAMSCMSSN